MSTGLIRAFALVGTSAVLALGGTAAAQASETDPSSEPSSGTFCWHEQITEREACADSSQELADTVLLEYGLRILGPVSEPDAAEAYEPSSAALSLAARAASPAATYVIGAFYTEPGLTGSSKVVTTGVTSNPCAQAGSYTYGYGNFVALWNDATSSFEGYGHCGFRLYWDADYTGSVYGPYFSRHSLGVFDNQASSFEAQKTD